jgi:hypothetical protein
VVLKRLYIVAAFAFVCAGLYADRTDAEVSPDVAETVKKWREQGVFLPTAVIVRNIVASSNPFRAAAEAMPTEAHCEAWTYWIFIYGGWKDLGDAIAVKAVALLRLRRDWIKHGGNTSAYFEYITEQYEDAITKKQDYKDLTEEYSQIAQWHSTVLRRLYAGEKDIWY